MKIIVGYKGINVGKDLMELAVEHAKAFGAEVLLVTSMVGGSDVSKKKFDEAESNLERGKDLFEENGVKCESHLLVRGMSAGEDIVKFAKEKEASEILIGVKSRSKVGKLLFGSTAQYVILRSPCPVVTVR